MASLKNARETATKCARKSPVLKQGKACKIQIFKYLDNNLSTIKLALKNFSSRIMAMSLKGPQQFSNQNSMT